MEVKVMSRDKNHIELLIEDVDFGVVDSLQEVLNKQEEVEYAGAFPLHPLMNKIRLILRTRGEADPAEALEKGLTTLANLSRELREEIAALLEKV